MFRFGTVFDLKRIINKIFCKETLNAGLERGIESDGRRSRVARSNVVPFRRSSGPGGLTYELCIEAAHKIRMAAAERIDHLRTEVDQCVERAIEAPEKTSAALIDQAVELRIQTREVIGRYGSAIDYWQQLAEIVSV